MPESGKPKSSREKVRRYRERLRQQGLWPIQIWVPDVRAPSFRVQAHRQSLAVAESATAYEDQAFIDAVSELGVTQYVVLGLDSARKAILLFSFLRLARSKSERQLVVRGHSPFDKPGPDELSGNDPSRSPFE
jgi:hypothetical protein